MRTQPYQTHCRIGVLQTRPYIMNYVHPVFENVAGTIELPLGLHAPALLVRITVVAGAASLIKHHKYCTVGATADCPPIRHL